MKRLFLLGTVICLVMPMVVIAYLTVVQQWVFPELVHADFTMRHWRETLLGGNDLLGSLALSLGISLTVAIVATSLGFGLSEFLTRSSKTQTWISWSYFPYVMAPVVLGAMWQFYFVRWGWSGSVLGVVIAQILYATPYAVLFLAGFWNDRIRQTAFQATTLGAHGRTVFWRIWMPMAKSWLLVCLFQCFLISWFEYGITQLIGVGKVGTLTIQTMQHVREANPHLAAVSACLMIIPTLGLLIINRQIFFRKIGA
ncbi:hypothetical protein [Pontibacter sp. G13]|uniref:ABC transporter permease n=1 Tax=Pontibacter sp. G13 TaxID=3074898 RepID=UPI00288A00AD|nr:hypothetical protein [Pontibacter sp. G13]WNJ20014.1 hypothetical protein RJD25_05980 [Pontibacter sp. G13]